MSDNNNTVNDSMLTTLDNPYNPFTHFDEWYAFDEQHGYNTFNYLARLVKTSDDLSDADERLVIEEAIDEVVKLNVLGIYVKVTKDTFVDRSMNIKHED
jgi:hypothetical protein